MTCPTRIILAVVSFMLFCLKSEAQKADSAGNLVENGWIEKMSDKVAFDLSVNNSYRTYEVETASNKILLYPNFCLLQNSIIFFSR